MLERLLEIRPQRMIYVFCNSATLARDLKILTQCTEDLEGAYEVKKIQLVDMFPWTSHVETVKELYWKGYKVGDKG